MGSPSICAGRHGGDVRRLQNEETCGAGAAAGGRYINNHRGRRSENVADNDAGRVEQPSGRVQFDEHSISMDFRGARNAAADVLFTDRLNGIVQMQQNNLRWLLSSVQRTAPEQCDGTEDEKHRFVPQIAHWTCCPLCSRACLMPRALALAGSILSAWLTSPDAALNWLACKSMRASTRCASIFG